MKPVLSEDIRRIADSGLPLEELRDSSLLITGATGLIGSLLVRTLLYCDRALDLNLSLYAVVRNREKAEGLFAEEAGSPALHFVVADLADSDSVIDAPCDYIFHAAAVTASKDMVRDPVGNIRTAVLGTDRLLRLAVDRGCRSFVYLSSMEVYGQPSAAEKTTEADLGYVDLYSVRSCYPEGKRICECLCAAYAAQYGLNVKCARLAQTFGAGTLPGENRVFAQFARSAMAGTDIVLHTTGESMGNYVYTRDALRALLLLLLRGRAGEAYNVANEESCRTIREMAELVASEIAEGSIQVVIDIPEDSASLGYAPPVQMRLDASKLRSLGWEPEVGLAESYRRLIAWLAP